MQPPRPRPPAGVWHSASLDDLVGAGEDRLWYLDADLARHLEVDDELEPGRLLGRRITRARAFQHLVDQRRLYCKKLTQCRAIARQTPGSRHFPPFANRRKLVRQKQRAEFSAGEKQQCRG